MACVVCGSADVCDCWDICACGRLIRATAERCSNPDPSRCTGRMPEREFQGRFWADAQTEQVGSMVRRYTFKTVEEEVLRWMREHQG